jgi:hypothetical protein
MRWASNVFSIFVPRFFPLREMLLPSGLHSPLALLSYIVIYINIIYDAFIIYYVPLAIYFLISFIHDRGFK